MDDHIAYQSALKTQLVVLKARRDEANKRAVQYEAELCQASIDALCDELEKVSKDIRNLQHHRQWL